MNLLDPQRGGIGLKAMAIIVGWFTTIIGAAWALSADRAETVGRITHAANAITDHETRLRVIETQTERIATDVKWIRAHLERKQDKP